MKSWADPVESDSCQEAGSGGQWGVCWGWRGGEIGQGLWARGSPAHSCPSHVVPLIAGQPGLQGVGLVELLGLGSDWARPVPSFAGVRGSRSEGGGQEVIREVFIMKTRRELKWGGHRSDDWDRQREAVGGDGQRKSGPREEIMGDGGRGGGQKEAVRRGGGQREQVIGSGGQRKRSEGGGGEGTCKRPHPLQVGFPWQGGSRPGSSSRELVRGSVARGTVWLWGSGQEALIHPRTRSAFFLSPKPRGKKHNKTGVNRLMGPEQLWVEKGGEGPRPAPSS